MAFEPSPTKECSGRTCNTQIAFVKTRKGKAMPVDGDSLSDKERDALAAGEMIDYRHGVHVPHHSTCPDVESFRRR